jgi:hypothetical protein
MSQTCATMHPARVAAASNAWSWRVIELYENGSTISSVLGDLGGNCDFGDLATRGRAESAVLKLLARHAR